MNDIDKKYIRKFFDNLEADISNIFSDKINVNEESLTFLLCLLLGDRFGKCLSYTFDDLENDLIKYGGEIEFNIHVQEHSRYYESEISNADLGIVVSAPNMKEKPMRIQCKKLKPTINDKDKNKALFSTKRQYPFKDKPKQYRELRNIYKDDRNICYLLFNPSCKSFKQKSDVIDYELDHQWEDYDPYLFDLKFHERVCEKPGIKITDINTIEYNKNHTSKKCSLEGFYTSDYEKKYFKSFSSFIIDLLTCEYGNMDDDTKRLEEIAICEGKTIEDDYFIEKENKNIKINKNPMPVTFSIIATKRKNKKLEKIKQ